MKRLGLVRDLGGAAALEFALVSLPFFAIIIGFIILATRLWAWQALTAVAAETARCAGINALSCQNVATASGNTITYATTIAPQYGFPGLTAGNVSVQTGARAQTACNNTTASVVYVALSYTYSWTAQIVPLPATVSASACFPLPTS